MDDEKKDLENIEVENTEPQTNEGNTAESSEEGKTGFAALLEFLKDKKKIVIPVLAALIIIVLGIGIAVGANSGKNSDNVASDDKETESTYLDANADGADETVTEQESTESVSETDDEDETSAKKETTTEDDEDNSEDEDSETEEESEDESEAVTEEEENSSEEESAAEESSAEQAATVAATTAATTVAAVPTEDVSATDTSDEDGTPYALHGKLTVSGTNILDENGDVYQLKGVSTHGIGWYPDYVNYDAFKTLRDEWGVNVVRIAMYTAEYNGYCEGGNQEWLKSIVNEGVEAATELGMYVIIDWHVLNDQNPNNYKDEALDFFKEISEKYASYGNVLYEICNEPNSSVSWSEVKGYAEDVIPVIRANCENIIIVGTTTWSQDVDQAAADPITGQSNIMYALHFYAATHKDDLRNKLIAASDAGLPIFVSEFGICDASGGGSIDEDSANTWIDLLNDRSISFCIWNLSNKSETCALISSSCSKLSGWSTSDLTASGKWFVKMMTGSSEVTGSSSDGSSGQSSTAGDAAVEKTTEATTEYVAPTTQAAVSASSGNCSVTAVNSNSWGDSSQGNYMQMDVIVNNTSSSSVTGWTVVLKFDGVVEIDSSWNGLVSVNGKTVTITSNADWNSTIEAGGSVSFGMIIKSSDSVEMVSCSVE